MKDSLFEILMSFFEKSLSLLRENQPANATTNTTKDTQEIEEPFTPATIENQTILVKTTTDNAIRVFSQDEKMRFSKASYQFLTRLMLWDIIAPETLELIINKLLFSESRFVTLQETKWTIHNTLADSLDSGQLAFLDLVLYQKEDEPPLH